MLNTIPALGKVSRTLLYSAVFVLFLCQVLIPILGRDLSRLPGDLGDNRFNLYLLEHTYKFISGQESTFWTAGFFYPHQNVVAYSDNFLGSCMFYVPYRVMGFDRETAFQLFIITGFALNFAAMAFVLDRYGYGWVAAGLGAAVFAFSPVQILQACHFSHVQVLYRMPVPLAWYFLDRFLHQYRPMYLALTLGFLAWQFYMSLYIGYFLFLVLFAYVIVVTVERRKTILGVYMQSTGQRTLLAHGCLLLASGAAVLPLYLHYSAPGVVHNTFGELLHLLPRPASYLVGSRDQIVEKLLGGQISVMSSMPGEHSLFVGAVPWLALLVATILAMRGGDSRNVKLRRVVFVFWAVFLMTLSVHNRSVYRVLVRVVPELIGIRVVARVVHVLLLPFAILTAEAIERLLRLPQSRMPVRIASAALVCLAFAWEANVGSNTISKAAAQQRVAALERSVGMRQRLPRVSNTGPVLAAIRVDDKEYDFIRPLDAMLAAQDLNIVTLNGYSRFSAPGFRPLNDCHALTEMLHDYGNRFASFSSLDLPDRIRIAPSSVSCGTDLKQAVSGSTSGSRASMSVQ